MPKQMSPEKIQVYARGGRAAAAVSNFNVDLRDEHESLLKILPGYLVHFSLYHTKHSSVTSPRRRVASYSYLAVGVVQLAAVTPNDSERVPPVRALHVGVKLVLRQRNARCARRLGRRSGRGSDRSGRSRRH